METTPKLAQSQELVGSLEDQ
jgi:hypothetical protein